MSLFIPIEIILAGVTGDPAHQQQAKENLKRIRHLVTEHGEAEASVLLSFLNETAGAQRPSLASLFDHLASQAKLVGWEADIIAFRRFNATRNDLIHRGDQNTRLVVPVGNEETATLEDIAERYVSLALFDDGLVYRIVWRPDNKRSGQHDPGGSNGGTV